MGKKRILLFVSVGFLFQVILFLFSYSNLFESCYNNLSCREGLLRLIVIISPYVHLFIPLFIFSLITYKMREEVYITWFKFARWWIPLSMLAILISPEYSRDWLYPIEKGSVAFLTSIAFLIISALIVALKFFSSKRA